MRRFWFFKFALMGIGFVFLMGLAVQALWNWLIPTIFTGLGAITLLQALGLLVLSRILFGGWGKGCHGHYRHHKRGHWKKRFQEKWEKMTPEQREKFKDKFGGRRGWWQKWEEDFHYEDEDKKHEI